MHAYMYQCMFMHVSVHRRFCSYPSSEVMEECLEIDFGEVSKSESDLKIGIKCLDQFAPQVKSSAPSANLHFASLKVKLVSITIILAPFLVKRVLIT